MRGLVLQPLLEHSLRVLCGMNQEEEGKGEERHSPSLVPASLFYGSIKAYSFQRNLETIWFGERRDIFSLRQIPSRDRSSACQS